MQENLRRSIAKAKKLIKCKLNLKKQIKWEVEIQRATMENIRANVSTKQDNTVPVLTNSNMDEDVHNTNVVLQDSNADGKLYNNDAVLSHSNANAELNNDTLRYFKIVTQMEKKTSSMLNF